ncbi:MAG: Do family serine endopeptidase [Treponema sp.]|nr:Do family serine endopeptidase [Treponema sp.]
MKTWTKCLIGVAGAAVLSFGVISLSCSKTPVVGNASTAYAESSAIVPSESLKIVEALQNSFRAISDGVLPSVVEVDVTETKTVQTIDPFDDIRRYFFGVPDDNNDNKKGRTREYEQKGLGSGVIVRRTGDTLYVLTNNHVAGEATKISVKLNDGREFDGKLVGADARMDVALVSFESKDKSIPVAILGDSDLVKTGDICLAMGAPLGYSQSVTQGIVSAKGRSGSGIGNINDFIQTDAAINQGNSGGPLVNIYGEIIGINTWIASQSGGSQGLGFSIPINNIKGAIDSFISSGKVVYGWLGVSLMPASNDYKEALGVNDKDGALAAQVFIGSPAQKGGMRPGDYIISVGGHKIKDVDQVQREVGRLEAGKTVDFVVVRDGKEVTLSVKIEERTEKVSSDSGKLWPGFIAAPITEDIKKQFELDTDKGVLVTNVLAKSPASALRLQQGDVITAVNGKSVKNLKEFYAELSKVEKSVNFDVYSNGGTITTGTYKF